MFNCLKAVTLGVLSAMLMSTTAFASYTGIAEEDPTALVYLADEGIDNDFTGTKGDEAYAFEDSTEEIVPGEGCELLDEAVICTADSIEVVAAALGDGDDHALVQGTNSAAFFVLDGDEGADALMGSDDSDLLYGGPDQDVLTGNGGGDILDGGEGNDQISSRDSEADSVTCGDGNDSVTADVQDEVAADCETVDTGVSTPPPGTDSGTGSGGRSPKSPSNTVGRTAAQQQPPVQMTVKKAKKAKKSKKGKRSKKGSKKHKKKRSSHKNKKAKSKGSRR